MGSNDMKVALRIEGVNAAALTAHSVLAQRLFPELNAAEIAVAGGVASFVGAKSPFSYAVGLGLHGPVSADEIGALVKFYRALGGTPRVDVCTLADESLLDQLRAHGFRLHAFVNVLTRSISGWDRMYTPAAGIKVRVAAVDEAERWSQLVAAGFLEGKPYTETERHLGLLTYHQPTSRAYIAEIDGEPVGAAALFTSDGYAAMFAASTRPEFRGRGVQAALIRARLIDAQQLHCELAGLFATPGSVSQRNAERSGFRLTYTKAILKQDGQP